MSGARSGGPVVIHPTAFVAPGARIVGDVKLGARSSVWFNTVVRGDSAPVEVGAESNVQDISVIHVDEGQPAMIGARVTVGHRAILHGCVIEDECLIGMGAVVLSGARIGAGSLIGSGSLVREGQIIPAGTLALGSPARVVGPLGPEYRETILRGTSHYVELAQAYMKRGLARSADRWGAVVGDAGPMSRREWLGLVRELSESPAWVEARMGERGPDAWRHPGTLVLLGLMRDGDRDLRRPCLERLLRGEEGVMVETADSELRARRPPEQAGAVLADWREARAGLCRALAALGPEEWWRYAGHRTRGPLTLAELARDWVEEDLERRGALLAGLGAA